MEIVVFQGELKLGDGANASMLFAQDFRLFQCAGKDRRLTIECEGVEIFGPELHKDVSSHPVYLDHTLVGRLSGNSAEFTILPDMEAGAHRVRLEVSPFPGTGLCDDFLLRRVVFSCKE